MFKTIAIGFVTAIALLLIYASTRPDSFRVERSARIQAPPERIFALINDLQQFNRWNPYEKKDPAIKGTYGKTTVGPGAHYGWVSNEVGVGSMEITEVSAPSRVLMRLDFIKPMETSSQAEFTLKPLSDQGTEIVWSMQGPAPYVSKLMGVLFNMDKMIGKDFEDGLANLKVLAEQKS